MSNSKNNFGEYLSFAFALVGLSTVIVPFAMVWIAEDNPPLVFWIARELVFLEAKHDVWLLLISAVVTGSNIASSQRASRSELRTLWPSRFGIVVGAVMMILSLFLILVRTTTDY